MGTNESKLSTSFEIRDRVREYCKLHGLKQFFFVNEVMKKEMDRLEGLDEQKTSINDGH